MNKLTITILKILRKVYSKTLGNKSNVLPECEQNPDIASKLIYKALTDNKPCMIARFGSTELTCLINYMGVKNHQNDYLNYIKGNSQPWWWEQSIIEQMQRWSGFFPPTISKIEQFCELMLQDILEVDVLGSWLTSEHYFNEILKNVPKIRLGLLDPYWAQKPWTKALEGKKVLVIHPFTETIEKQYKKRELLFKNNVLPEFQLKTIKAVQSIAGTKTEFKDWFEALEAMKTKIDKTDYDICLIGAGAYGFPLAAHVKCTGKKAIHIGGSLQLLFGIRGKRWEDKNYHNTYDYTTLINKYWVKPNQNDKPKNANKVEDGCYW
ncbi:GT-D fold domain-containing protein [Lutibacter sp.]